jgi:unsaturated rhamnogalacturonyl hydrolase
MNWNHCPRTLLLVTAAFVIVAQTHSPAMAGQPPPSLTQSAITSTPDSTLYLPLVANAVSGPLWLVAQRGEAALPPGQCDWEAGVLAYGWIHAWRVTGTEQFLLWTQAWIDNCIPLTPAITHVNDGLLGYAALVTYEVYGGATRLNFAQTVADYFMNTATRTADGTLTHFGDTVWDDTLLGTVPFLLEMSKVTGNPAYAEEAYAQIIQHAGHLQDQATGLYHHAWDESQNEFIGAVYWGRGNGWAMLAGVEVLTVMTATHPLRATVLSIFQQQAAGLRSLQDSSGLWHTVVTRPDVYLETSATALIGYAFRRGVESGWLNTADYAPAASAASAAVWRKVLADGTVTDVSGPTGPMATELDYNAIAHDQLQLYGQGLALLMDQPFGP